VGGIFNPSGVVYSQFMAQKYSVGKNIYDMKIARVTAEQMKSVLFCDATRKIDETFNHLPRQWKIGITWVIQFFSLIIPPSKSEIKGQLSLPLFLTYFLLEFNLK